MLAHQGHTQSCAGHPMRFAGLDRSSGAPAADEASGQIDMGAKRIRLLVPVSASEESQNSLEYATRLGRSGVSVEVVLLNVGEIITDWRVLRFRTQQEVAEFQADRARAFFEQAEEFLAERNIACRSVFRRGEVVFSILDVAEELACDQIVLPYQGGWASSIFCPGTGLEVSKKQRGIPVVLVGRSGEPVC